MRILHTADWHMNRRLRRQPLDEDIRQSLQQIAGYLEEYEVDVLVVAGDVLEKTHRIEEMKRAVFDIKEIFQPFLARGGTMVAISGNHDNEPFFETLRDALALVEPGQPTSTGIHSNGRLYVAPNARVLRLADRAGQAVQFVLMPYPTPRAYPPETAKFGSIETKHQAIQAAFRGRLNHIIQSRLDPTLPSVLVSHVHVRGVTTHSLYRITEAEDVVFEVGDIPAGWAYVAYGHIHRPQPALSGADHIRYAGSIVRLDGAERDDYKSVVLCDIGQEGLKELDLLPLQTAPMYRIEITDPESQLSGLAERYPDAKRALVHYTLHWDPGRHDRHALRREIEACFPRWYESEFHVIGEALPARRFQANHIEDVVGTVRSYLEMQLKDNPRKEVLMALAEALMAEEGEE